MDQIVQVSAQIRSHDDISLRDLLRILVRHRTTIIAVTVVMTAIAVVTGILMTPVYRASVLVAPVESKDPLGALGAMASQVAGVAGLGIGRGDRLRQEALAIMQSRTLTEKFIEKYDLLPKLFPDLWDDDTKKWNVPDEQIPTLARGFKIFDRSVRTVSEDQLTGLITISMEHPNRVAATEWANALVQEVNGYVRQRAIGEAESSLRYLNEELVKTDVVELRLGINRLIEQQLKDVMLANVRHEYVFRVIDPAVVPEHKSFVRPRRLLMAVGGMFIGLLLGVFAALLKHAFSADDQVVARN